MENIVYQIIRIFSLFVRQWLFPNPFEPLAGALIYNWLAEPIIHMVTFIIVGIFYDRGSEPALGSFLYLIFYGIHTGVLMLIGFFGWSQLAFCFVLGGYFSLILLLKRKYVISIADQYLTKRNLVKQYNVHN